MTILPLTIRNCTWQDYRYCYTLTKKNMFHYFEKYCGGWKPNGFRDNFNPRHTKMIIKNQRRIGYYVVKIKKSVHYIDNIQISASMRGKGLGAYILNIIEKQTLRSKNHRIQLTVFKDNPARRLYERLGYKIIRDKGSSILMQKRI